jgi:hypothetical protein
MAAGAPNGGRLLNERVLAAQGAYLWQCLGDWAPTCGVPNERVSAAQTADL